MNCIAYFDAKTNNNISGTIKFHQCNHESKTIISISLSGLPKNTTRGIHIHRCGDLSKGCESACEHYNPMNNNHGCYPSSRHVGDLVNNITSNDKGEVNFTYLDNLVDLFGKYSVLGRSVVIHSLRDDLGLGNNKESLKTGNAGKRIACAIIGISGDNFCKLQDKIEFIM